MALTRVTITGADDRVSIPELKELAAEFPFVEFGVLIGAYTKAESRDKQRYPSVRWIQNLADCYYDANLDLSLHVCGHWLLSLLRGDALGLLALLSLRTTVAFQRMQLNWAGMCQTTAEIRGLLKALEILAIAGWHQDIICQSNTTNGVTITELRKLLPEDLLQVLYDCSGGRGIVPPAWPKPPSWALTGWAGGLSPDNLAAALPEIDAVAMQDYWIDMESGVRTGGELDLAKVRQVLEISREFMTRKLEDTCQK